MDFPMTMAALALDLAAIATLAYALYFRRHRRRDLLGAYVALNLGVFSAVTLLVAQEVGVALGFGLFGILSIVRLRSSSITQQEVGYYFVALTLGLVNGLGFDRLGVTAALDALLILGMFAADHPRLAARVERRSVVLDAVHRDNAALRADLERRLGGEVLRCVVGAVDYTEATTTCDVRFRAGAGAAPRIAEERQTVLLDAVHRDRHALLADLERRLGGEVLGCTVIETDYAQGTTRCEVRLRTPVELAAAGAEPDRGAIAAGSAPPEPGQPARRALAGAVR
jgi:hypothetical protein